MAYVGKGGKADDFVKRIIQEGECTCIGTRKMCCLSSEETFGFFEHLIGNVFSDDESLRSDEVYKMGCHSACARTHVQHAVPGGYTKSDQVILEHGIVRHVGVPFGSDLVEILSMVL